MFVGVMEVTLAVPATSLKEKRSVVKRILSKMRQTFHLAAAEVDEQDMVGTAVLGFTIVSSDHQFVERVLTKTLDAIDDMYLAEIIDDSRVIEKY